VVVEKKLRKGGRRGAGKVRRLKNRGL